MKNRTQYQTETTLKATEKPCSNTQANIPRKWRGNTLVPVIIALAISGIATIAFLNQGATLSADNKIVIAQNEIASALSDWVVAREAGALTTGTLPGGGDNIYGTGYIAFDKFSGSTAITTVINATSSDAKKPIIAVDGPYMVFRTDNDNNCETLASRVSSSADGVSDTTCINNTTLTANSTPGEYLVIVLK